MVDKKAWIGVAIHQASGPMLAVQPTVELAKRNSRQRIDPLIDESPALRDKVKPARAGATGNTMLKEFAGGILIMTGANSAVGLRSTTARYIFLDEVDACSASADVEDDPVTLAEARSLTFAYRRKVFLVSRTSGGYPGSSGSTRPPISGVISFRALTVVRRNNCNYLSGNTTISSDR
jgi:phage terminase large subunit GpA-like protein